MIDTLSEMSQNLDKQWNRDTVGQASSLLKSLDFEFVINLVITQKILAYTSGITTGLQKRGIDLANASEQVKLVIRTLSRVRQDVETFHHSCYDEACIIASKIDVDIRRPRICGRQVYRQNALQLDSGLSDEQLIEDYFRVNVTIPLLDDVLGSLQSRFEEGQENVIKGILLLPSSTIVSESDWDSAVDRFLKGYVDEIPSHHTLEAEKLLWKQLWQEKWEEKLNILKQQHIASTGEEMNLSATELAKLKHGAVPNTIASTLKVINQHMFPNITYLLSILAVLPITTCEAERSISTLAFENMRSTMGQERFSGLALMNIHLDIPINIDEIIDDFSQKHPRRMQLENILKD